MATYAAFKHIELHKVGHGKNRVPNAPRGCIGEIFGEGTQNEPAKAPNSPDTPCRPRDTHSRLFGAPTRANTAVRDTLRSNISFGGDEKRPESNGSNGSNGNHHGHSDNGHSNGHHGHSNGQINGHSISPAKEGNPITGDGYKSMNGEINTSVTALNGNATPINHNRIPPGGYSSGLW